MNGLLHCLHVCVCTVSECVCLPDCIHTAVVKMQFNNGHEGCLEVQCKVKMQAIIFVTELHVLQLALGTGVSVYEAGSCFANS